MQTVFEGALWYMQTRHRVPIVFSDDLRAQTLATIAAVRATGTAVAEAARVLATGGRLWCVWNSHLRHRPVLEAEVGPTRQVARDRTFTVTVSTRR